MKEKLKRWRILAVQQSWEGEVCRGERVNMMLNTDSFLYGSDLPLVREIVYKFDEDSKRPQCDFLLDEEHLKR